MPCLFYILLTKIIIPSFRYESDCVLGIISRSAKNNGNLRRQNRKKKLLFLKLLSKKYFFYYLYLIRYTNMLLTEHQVTLEGGLKKVFEEVFVSWPEITFISEHDDARKESLGHATSIIDMISLCLSRVSQYALIAQRIEKTLKYAYQVWPWMTSEYFYILNFSIIIWIFNLHYR